MESVGTLPNAVCARCLTRAMDAMMFRSQCQESIQTWHCIVDSLATIKASRSNIKSVYAHIADRVTILQDSKPSKTHKLALKNFKSKYLQVKSTKRRLDKIKRIQNNSIESDVKCPNCGKKFVSASYLKKHLMLSPYRICWMCQKIFTLDNFRKHLSECCNSKLYPCNSCQDIFKKPELLANHTHKCHRGKFPCPICDHQFKSTLSLSHHSARHDAEKCPKCFKNFRSRVCALHHSKYCGIEKRASQFICDACSKVYKTKSALKTHIHYDHLTDSRFQCSQCGKRCRSRCHLEEHYNTHVKILDRFVCEICELAYSTRRGYQKHYKKHLQEPLHEINILKITSDSD